MEGRHYEEKRQSIDGSITGTDHGYEPGWMRSEEGEHSRYGSGGQRGG